MDTFKLYKDKYIDRKLNFLDQLRYRKQYEKFVKNNPSKEEELRYEQYSNQTWEAMNSAINAANQMCNYVAQCAMERIQDDYLTCLIVSDNTIEDTNAPIFAFEFQFMVVPKLNLWADKDPQLNYLVDQISYGRVDLGQVQAVLADFDIPFGEIVTMDARSDRAFMRAPWGELIVELHSFAMSEIEEYKAGVAGTWLGWDSE